MNQYQHQQTFVQSILVMMFQESYRTFWLLDRAAEDKDVTTALLERPGATISSMIATESYLSSIEDFIKKKEALGRKLEEDQEILLGAWPADQRTRVSAICRNRIRDYDRRHIPYFIRRLHQ